MTREHPTVRRLLGGILAAVLPLLAVTVPIMDGLDYSGAPVLESRHDAGACPTGHDHTICTQAGANLAAPAPAPALLLPRVVRLPGTRTVAGHGEPDTLYGPPSRAPPSA